MKKSTLIISAILLLSISKICAQTTDKIGRIPLLAARAISKKYPEMSDAVWKKQDTLFIVEFKNDGTKTRSLFDLQGNLLETQVFTKVKKLPEPVKSTLKLQYKEYDAEESYTVETINKEVFYRGVLEKDSVILDLRMDNGGKVLTTKRSI